MNILLLDNYDSFTWNLALMVRCITGRLPVVRKNDRVSAADLAACDKILLSPGPGIPAEAGMLQEIIRAYAPVRSILGVCLGHQAIGEVFGAALYNLPEVWHGIATPIHPVLPDVLFREVEAPFTASRYHSWVVSREGFPDCLEVTAEDSHGQIMALRHKHYDVRGIQFHPESIMTPDGFRMMYNWINS